MPSESWKNGSDLPLCRMWRGHHDEAGSYGQDTKGLIRTHRFSSKVELVKNTTPATSEGVLQHLELPHRKIRWCAGDIGFSAQPRVGSLVAGCEQVSSNFVVWYDGRFSSAAYGVRRRLAAATKAEVEDAGGGGKKNKQPERAKPVYCHTKCDSGGSDFLGGGLEELPTTRWKCLTSSSLTTVNLWERSDSSAAVDAEKIVSRYSSVLAQIHSRILRNVTLDSSVRLRSMRLAWATSSLHTNRRTH